VAVRVDTEQHQAFQWRQVLLLQSLLVLVVLAVRLALETGVLAVAILYLVQLLLLAAVLALRAEIVAPAL
jgi:hypothetical protein